MSVIATTFCIPEESAPVPPYPLLKRPCERHVPMQAFDNPVVVEDVVRIASKFLKKNQRIQGFEIRSINLERIRNPSAFVLVSSG
ncbi:MAG: GTP cyclohydrolase, FolE2/MptA family [Negativicutes bacterium]|nr:GTP cyclohydrolase, FolE2/MptA family [Negativicutes bacterium]